MTFLSESSEALANIVREQLSTPVIYSRFFTDKKVWESIEGIDASLTVKRMKIVSNKYDRIDTQYGVSIVVYIYDFLLFPSDLILRNELILPEKKDRIQHDSILYEVHPSDEQEPVYRYTSASKKMIRVHTRLMGPIV